MANPKTAKRPPKKSAQAQISQSAAIEAISISASAAVTNANVARASVPGKGKGGVQEKLAKIGEVLEKPTTKRSHKTISTVPGDVPDNDMAPPPKRVRGKRVQSKTLSTAFNVSNVPEAPLLAAPKPLLSHTVTGSVYGFDAGPQNPPAVTMNQNITQPINTTRDNSGQSFLEQLYEQSNLPLVFNQPIPATHHNTLLPPAFSRKNRRQNLANTDQAPPRYLAAASEEDTGVDSTAGDDGHEEPSDDDNTSASESDRDPEAPDFDLTDPYNEQFYQPASNPSAQHYPALQFGDYMPNPRLAQEIKKVTSTEEPEIDEQSPDEDDRIALSGLRSTMLPEQDVNRSATSKDGNTDGTRDESDAVNVLEEHQRRNRQHRAPPLQNIPTNFADSEPEGNSSSDDETTAVTRAARNSNGPREKKADTLRFYPGHWQEVLTRAKKWMRRYTVLVHGFSDRNSDLDIAKDLLLRALAEFEHKGGVVENGFEQTRDMYCVVFKEIATYRSKMKLMARSIVQAKYHDTITVDFEGGNQLEEYSLIETQVKAILKNGLFLRNGYDHNNRTNNLSHPAIEELCVQFYYYDKNGLARIFPDDFKNEVPDHAVALAMTCIQNCLEEYENGYKHGIEISGVNYGDAYNAMLDIIEETKANEYHGLKYKKNVKRWARRGMKAINEKPKGPSRCALHVVLD